VSGSQFRHAEDGTFRKVMQSARARAEAAGWRAVADFLPVPRLLEVRDHGDHGELVYEDVFTTGRCRRLLADAINTADRESTAVGAVEDLLDGVCDDLVAAASTSGAGGRLDACVPDLYAARLASGARLDHWYVDAPQPAWQIEGECLRLADLATRTLVVDGRECRSPWDGLLERLRAELAPHTRWATAVTQGDVTEPNIADPLCWLDFEHAGRNVLAGDVANLLWYLLGMGGWLVPTYQPATYVRTLREPRPPLAHPIVQRLHMGRRRVEIEPAWVAGSGRRASLDAVVRRLDADLGAAIAPGSDVTDALRPFLAVRILGVIPLGQLSGPDALLCFAKLAELADPRLTLDDLVRTVPATLGA
jgi:hypothetical protein